MQEVLVPKSQNRYNADKAVKPENAWVDIYVIEFVFMSLAAKCYWQNSKINKKLKNIKYGLYYLKIV